MNSLACYNLHLILGGQPILRNLSVKFDSSGIVALIGPNGAGKTTLINVITGFLKPRAGRCLLGARQISGLQPYRIARLGIARTFQDLRLLRTLAVGENILLSMRFHPGEALTTALFLRSARTHERWCRDEVERFLDQVGLASRGDDETAILSYGQQKLLTIACCLASGAEILILDEPVAGVQPETRMEILEVLRRTAGQGRLLLFVEHDIEAVRAIADRVLVMDSGQIVADGSAAEVLDRQEVLDLYLT